MRKQFLCVLITVLLGTVAFAQNENVVVWEQIYKTTTSIEQKITVILKIMEFKDRAFTPFLVESLDTVATSRYDVGSSNERLGKIRLSRYLVQELGNLKATEAADVVFVVYKESPDMVLKSEAAIALGMMRADSFAEQLSFDLAAINNGPIPSQQRDQEIQALGLVRSLEAMRSTLGYESVFHAASGWYSARSGVREAAQQALTTMIDDPADNLLAIISGNPDLEVKMRALQAVMASGSPENRKAELARSALKIGIDRKSDTVSADAAASRLRTASINYLAALNDKSPESVPLLTQVVMADDSQKTDSTLAEATRAYVALGVNGTDEAAQFLASRLANYNNRETSKLNTARDKMLIRQVIASMVTSRNAKVKPALEQGQYITNYDNAIIRLMQDALKSLQ